MVRMSLTLVANRKNAPCIGGWWELCLLTLVFSGNYASLHWGSVGRMPPYTGGQWEECLLGERPPYISGQQEDLIPPYSGGQNGNLIDSKKRSLVSWYWLCKAVLDWKLLAIFRWEVNPPLLKEPLATSGRTLVKNDDFVIHGIEVDCRVSKLPR